MRMGQGWNQIVVVQGGDDAAGGCADGNGSEHKLQRPAHRTGASLDVGGRGKGIQGNFWVPGSGARK